VSALAHYIENRGIATAVIGLIPQHVERVAPPRALNVPFELGRPLGAPHQPELQRHVLARVLKLCESPGPPPVIEHYEADAAPTPAGDDEDAWVCPVNFAPPPDAAPATLRQAVREEVIRLKPWWGQATRERGRTAAATSGLEPEGIADFLADLLGNPETPPPVGDLALGDALKLAAEDLKAFYLEAATARPGASSRDLADWFWQQTSAGELLYALRGALAEHEDDAVSLFARFTLVPAGR